MLCQVELWEVTEHKFSAKNNGSVQYSSFWIYLLSVQMVYRRSRTNIRRPVRRRRYTAKTAVRRRRAPLRRRRARPNARVRVIRSAEMDPSTRFVYAQLDPFEPAALGAKVPDSNTMPSIANCDTDQVSITAPSVAGRLVGMAFLPSYQASSFTATEGAVSISWPVATGWNKRRNADNVVASVEAFRPVAHAIRLSSGLSPTTATGFVHIGLDVESRISSSTLVADPDFPRTINEMTGLAFYKKVTLASLTQSPITCINKWIDESAFRYQDPREQPALVVGPAVTTGTSQQPYFNFFNNWATIIVIIEGAPTGSNPLSVEHLLSTEMLPRKDAFILGGAAAPNSAGTMAAASSMAADTEFAHTEAEQQSYIARGAQSFMRHAEASGEQVLNNVAIPIAERAMGLAFQAGSSYISNQLFGTGGISGVNSNPSRLALN